MKKHFFAILVAMILSTVSVSTAEYRKNKNADQIEQLIATMANHFQKLEGKGHLPFDDTFFGAQIQKESRGIHTLKDGSLIKSKAGALGVAQFMPKTWRWLKKKSILPSHFNIKNKEHQKEAQKIYMKYLYEYDYGTTILCQRELAIAAYNCGPGRVSREVKKHKHKWKEHLPKETINYLKKLS